MGAELAFYPGAPVEAGEAIIHAYRQMLERGAITQEVIQKSAVYPPRLDRPLFVWILTSAGIPYGEVSLGNLDSYQGKAELGAIAASDSPKIMVSRTVLRVVQYAFSDLKLNRVEAWVRASNGNTVNQLKRFGFKKEGTARKAVRSNNGRFEDALLFGMLSSEFHERWNNHGSAGTTNRNHREYASLHVGSE